MNRTGWTSTPNVLKVKGYCSGGTVGGTGLSLARGVGGTHAEPNGGTGEVEDVPVNNSGYEGEENWIGGVSSLNLSNIGAEVWQVVSSRLGTENASEWDLVIEYIRRTVTDA